MLNLGGRHGGKGAGVAAFDCNTGKLIMLLIMKAAMLFNQSKTSRKRHSSLFTVKVLLGPGIWEVG